MGAEGFLSPTVPPQVDDLDRRNVKMMKKLNTPQYRREIPKEKIMKRSARVLVTEYISMRRDLKNSEMRARFFSGKDLPLEFDEKLKEINGIKNELIKFGINPTLPDKSLLNIVRNGNGRSFSFSGDGKRRPGKSTGTYGVGSKLKFWC